MYYDERQGVWMGDYQAAMEAEGERLMAASERHFEALEKLARIASALRTEFQESDRSRRYHRLRCRLNAVIEGLWQN